MSAATVRPISRYSTVNWLTAIAMVIFHLLAVTALFYFSWTLLAATVALYWVAVGFGISMGYHRLHTHRSYKVPRWLEYFFALCGTLTLEGGPIFWVAVHRLHHQLSDQPGDPHSPRDGAFWSHMGWILWGETNHNNTRVMRVRAGPGQAQVLRLAHQLSLGAQRRPRCHRAPGRRHRHVPLGHVLPHRVRTARHLGRQFRDSHVRQPPLPHPRELPNTWWIALISFGEGWHNNHHAHPTSARHGLAWYELDQSWLLIKALKFFGLAKNVRVASVDSGLAEEKAA